MAKANSTNKEVVDSCDSTHRICMLMLTVSAVMAFCCGIIYPRNVRKKADILIRVYLRDIFKRYPNETKPYRFVLYDINKLEEIGAVACNRLTPEEQKLILTFIKTVTDKPESNNNISKLNQIADMIMDVIETHAKKDPTITSNTLFAITSAKQQDLMLFPQKTR
jgi:hypothetical protein